jgi:hypothetical protein
MAPGDIGPGGLRDPWTLFHELVPPGGKVLVTGEDSRGTLVRLGFDVEKPGQDLRMLGTPAEAFDAIWWSQANAHYSVEDAFRILQTFFRALRPKKGILVLSFSKESKEHPWEPRTVMTLLRQCGLQHFHGFENAEAHLYFCQRI